MCLLTNDSQNRTKMDESLKVLSVFSMPAIKNVSLALAWLVWFYINLSTISYRKGVEFADYLPVKLAFDSAKKQVYIKPENDLLWIEVCSDEDPQCQRSNT